MSAQIARVLYDSYHQPLPTGLRSSVRFGRQFVFLYDNVRVDLVIEPQSESGRISLVGQVVDASKPEAKCNDLPVVLVAREGPVARTTTNGMGEFHLDCQFAGAADLKVRVGESSWVVIPLGDMEWVRKRLSGSEATA